MQYIYHTIKDQMYCTSSSLEVVSSSSITFFGKHRRCDLNHNNVDVASFVCWCCFEVAWTCVVIVICTVQLLMHENILHVDEWVYKDTECHWIGSKIYDLDFMVISAAIIYFWKYPNENAYMLLMEKWIYFFVLFFVNNDNHRGWPVVGNEF